MRVLFRSIVGIVEADTFHRPVTKRLHASRGHDFDRHAAIEIGRVRFPFTELGLLAIHQALVKRDILLLRHGAIDVIAALVRSFRALVPTALNPTLGHVDTVAVDDRRNGIEKGQAILPGRADDALRQRLCGQRSGRDDCGAGSGQGIHAFAHDGNIGVLFEATLDLCREDVPIHGHGAAGRNARHFTGTHDDAVEPAHFVMQQTDGVLLAIVGTEAVRTDEFGEAVRLVCGRRLAAATHLGQADLEPAPCKLPCRLAPSKPATDDVNVVCH